MIRFEYYTPHELLSYANGVRSVSMEVDSTDQTIDTVLAAFGQFLTAIGYSEQLVRDRLGEGG